MAKVSPRPADRDLAELGADPENPREISDENLAGLETSVHDFGDLSGIVFNRRTQQLVTGHQRLTALMNAGAKTWKHTDPSGGRGVIVHPETGEEFPVRIVDWDEGKQRLANLAANNPEVAGTFTAAALEQLRALEEDAAFTALRLDALQELIAEDQPDDGSGGRSGGGNGDPNAVPEPPTVATTRPGDLWILGTHRLLCADSTNTADVTRLMNGKRAALMATDPPYGVNFSDGEGKNIAADMDYSVIPGFFGVAVDQLQPGRAILCFGAETNYGLYGALYGRELRMRPRLLFWKKTNFVLRHHDYHSQYECIFYGWTKGGDAHTRWKGGRDQADVWEVAHDVSSVNKEHPTQKPVELFERAIQNHTAPGEVCYEPFSGSGSQIIAGERLGRPIYAMEVDPKYCDVAVARWQAFTGRKAECHHAENVGQAADPVHGDDDVAF